MPIATNSMKVLDDDQLLNYTAGFRGDHFLDTALLTTPGAGMSSRPR